MSARRTAEARTPLPPRYQEGWRELFDEVVEQHVRSGITVLDVGSGRNPSISPADRPSGMTYIGIDVSEDELKRAGDKAYDECVPADLATHVPGLVNTTDLAVSWQVLEHVKPLGVALDNIYDYLKPGGIFVAMLSGGRSLFGLANRMLPNAVGKRVVTWSMRRDEQAPVFPAYYDRCTESALREILTKWSEVEIRPFFRGAGYFQFSTTLARTYLVYENAMERRGRTNWASHYLITARR